MYKRTFILATVAVLAMVSCAKELQQTVPDSFGSTDVHSLSVGIEAGEYLPTDATKASMNAIVRVDWKQGDTVSVVNATTGKILGGCLKADSDGAVTTFSGNVSGTLNKNDKLYYIFPALDVQGETPFSEQEISLKAQTYDATKPNEVCFHGYAEDTYSGDNSIETHISKSIKFNPVTAYVHLNMANIPAKNADLTSIDLSNVNGGFKWVLENTTVSAQSYLEDQGISVTCSNTKISQSGNAVVRFAVPASPATEEARVLTVNKPYSLSNYSQVERRAAAYYNQLYSTWVSSNVEVDDKGTEVNVKIDNGGSTESAEAALPVMEAFKSGKTEGTKIEMGGVGTVIFDQTASEKILGNAEDAGSTNVFFKVEDVTKEADVQNKNIVYEVTMKTVDEQGVEVFSEDKAEGVATVQVPLGDNVLDVQSVQLLNAEGQPIEGGVVDNSITFDLSSRILTFKVVHFSKYAITYTERTQPITAVAQIGERNYETLSSAVAAAQNGNTIKLLCDCMDAEGIIVPGGKNFTLDFGGHTYKVTKDLAGSTGTKNQCFQLLKGSTLVFQDGTITTSCAKLGINSYSDLIVKDVTVDMSQTSATGQVACLETCNGSISLQGNTSLKTKNDQIAVLALYWPNGVYGDINVELNTTGEVKGLMAYGSYQVQDLSTVAQHSHVAIKNGKYDVTFDMDNLENYDFKIYGGVFKTSPDTKYLAPNHEVVTNTDSETSASYPHKVQQKPYVAQIGDTKYFTLAAAVAAVPANTQTTITMIGNDYYEVNNPITIGKDLNVVLDLNGKTVSAVAPSGYGSALFTNNGALTINDSGSEGKLLMLANSPDGREIPGYASNTVTNNGKLVVNGGIIENQTTSSAGQACYPIDNITNGGLYSPTVEINGGQLIAKSNAALRLFCNSTTKENNVKINGGEFTALYYAVSMQNSDNNGQTANIGNLIIKGGTFEATANEWNCSVACWTKSDAFSISIDGGKFNDNVVIAEGNKSVAITGGLFKYKEFTDTEDGTQYELDNYVADGYAVVDNTDSATKTEYPYTVKFHPVVKIGNVEYANIAAAFAAVPTDGTPTTVTLLENIGSKNGEEIVWKEYDRTFAYTVNDNQNITFDLNGKKIYAKTTVNGYTGFLLVKNGGSLTIKDSAEGGELNYLDGNDNNGGLAISSEGNLTIQSGTIENHTECKASAIQGAIDVHANEWGTPYASHVTFKMDGGVLKSHNDNTLRIYDSSQTGKGTVVFDFEISGGEIYGADAVFIMTQWTKDYCCGTDTYMNNINASVTGGKFVTKNGIRVVGNVGDDNNKNYMAIKINVSGGDFTILSSKESKHRVNNVAFQESAGWTSTEESTQHLRSYSEVIWTASEPKYETPAQQ